MMKIVENIKRWVLLYSKFSYEIGKDRKLQNDNYLLQKSVHKTIRIPLNYEMKSSLNI